MASLITSSFNPVIAADHLAFSTLRQLGMGGVGIAQTYDAAALYINPAGLSEAKKELKLPSRLRVDINTHTLDSQSDLKYFCNSPGTPSKPFF